MARIVETRAETTWTRAARATRGPPPSCCSRSCSARCVPNWQPDQPRQEPVRRLTGWMCMLSEARGSVRRTALAQKRWCQSAEQDPLTQHGEARPSIHLSFQEFDLGVGALAGSVAVGQAQPGGDGVEVLA